MHTCRNAHTHTHNHKCHCDDYVSLTTTGLDKNYTLNLRFVVSIRRKINMFKLKLFNRKPHNADFHKPWKRCLFHTLREKEKMLVTSIFSSCHKLFYLIQETLHHLSKTDIVVCTCFSIWTRLKFSGKGIKYSVIIKQ